MGLFNWLFGDRKAPKPTGARRSLKGGLESGGISLGGKVFEILEYQSKCHARVQAGETEYLPELAAELKAALDQNGIDPNQWGPLNGDTVGEVLAELFASASAASLMRPKSAAPAPRDEMAGDMKPPGCQTCNGSGKVMAVKPRDVGGHASHGVYERCPDCFGTAKK